MNSLFLFFSAFNTSYNNKFRFFYYRNVPKLRIILNLFMKKGLILGFYIMHKIVVINLRYINDAPFFKIITISKPSRRFFYKFEKKIKGSLSGSNLYILNSYSKGFYFSDTYEGYNNYKEGGEIFLKITFCNENSFSKKNNII